MFTKLDSQSLCIYLELLSMKGIGKSISLHPYLLVMNSPVIWLFGLVVVLNEGKICIEKMMGFRGDDVRFLKKKLIFLFWPSLIQIK